MSRPFLTGAVALAALALGSAGAQAQSGACDAACMADLSSRFMAAMTRADPRGLPWAAKVGYAENSVRQRVGEGSWVTIKAAGSARSRTMASPASMRWT
jgi:hypothetical protein